VAALPDVEIVVARAALISFEFLELLMELNSELELLPK